MKYFVRYIRREVERVKRVVMSFIKSYLELL